MKMTVIINAMKTTLNIFRKIGQIVEFNRGDLDNNFTQWIKTAVSYHNSSDQASKMYRRDQFKHHQHRHRLHQ